MLSKALPQPILRKLARALSSAPRIVSRADHGPVLNVPPLIVQKKGIEHVWGMPDGAEKEVLSIGGACSEVFQGSQLASVLQPGHDYEARALAALKGEDFAPALVQHTSAALPTQYGAFVSELEKHLPAYAKDWCLSLQVEGASAVMAAVEMLLHLQSARGQPQRTGVAVADRSYHGPPSTSLGVPAGKMDPAASAIKPHSLMYPAPHIFRGEGDIKAVWKDWFDAQGDTLGVVIVEPQWGSSCAASPWPKELLADFIKMAQERGALVLADEIMCGLYRHGQGTMFLTDAWGIEADALTFGKAVASGVFPMAGAVLTNGTSELREGGKKLGQSHTYAAASPRALMAATETLKAIPQWTGNITAAAEALDAGLKKCCAAANGKVVTHGTGLMRGAVFDPLDAGLDRVKAAGVLKKHCRDERVWPYFVPAGGVMCTPPYNVPPEVVTEAGDRMERAFAKTAAEMGW
mmetsp:Transcript_13026/g.38791  ORF Transcript_13026/g.38791 Transcript_13026/m.38791 type:complete len:464 (+) Transcript_13026:651-2042(+)